MITVSQKTRNETKYIFNNIFKSDIIFHRSQNTKILQRLL